MLIYKKMKFNHFKNGEKLHLNNNMKRKVLKTYLIGKIYQLLGEHIH